MDRLDQLRELLKDDPNDPFLRYAFALEHAARGQRTEAITLIENLLKEQPDYLGAYYQLGQYYEQEGRNDDAIRTYQSGVALAQKQGNKKTLGELNEALWMLED